MTLSSRRIVAADLSVSSQPTKKRNRELKHCHTTRCFLCLYM